MSKNFDPLFESIRQENVALTKEVYELNLRIKALERENLVLSISGLTVAI
jgi:hypothetical protein